MSKLQKLKTLAIKTFKSHKSATGTELETSVKLFTEKLDNIIASKIENDAFYEIAYFTKIEETQHREFLNWSDEDVDNAITELSIEIDNL